MLNIRPMSHDEVESVYAHVKRDFPPIEYPPLKKMKVHFANSAVEGHLYASNEKSAAYAFMLKAEEISRIMLFLYAVEPGLRGKGVGSKFLKELFARYANRDGMYAEVEIPELAPTPQERRVCQSRIVFYQRLGFKRVQNLHYCIYGVQMHLFYKPIANKNVPDAPGAIRDVTALYNGILLPEERYNLDASPL